MVSEESKTRAMKLAFLASFTFGIASFLVREMNNIFSILFYIVSFTLFTISGILFISSFLILLNDRKSFLKSMKVIFEHVKEKTENKTVPIVYEKSKREIFIANKDLNKFHRSTCRIGKMIKKDKRIYFYSIDEAIKKGFEPCKNCNSDVTD